MGTVKYWLRVVAILITSCIMRSEEGSYCEPMAIPLCQDMPYNQIQMPNLLYHSTQQNANLVLDQYRELLKTNCSGVLHFYLCTMFAPICPTQFQQKKIPPCRGVCEKARAGCEPIMLEYNVSWPKDLACDGLPVYERGVCLSPEAIIENPAEDPLHTETKNSTKGLRKGCNCKNATKISARDAFLKNRGYDYAMKIKFRSVELERGGIVLLRVYVGKVFKQGRVRIKRGSITEISYEAGCICPRMKAGRKYIIMGHEDRRLSRLLYDTNSVASRWKKKWNGSLEQWEKIATRKNKRLHRQRKAKRKHSKKSRKHRKSNLRARSGSNSRRKHASHHELEEATL